MSLFDPKIRRHLISDQGEVVIDEVRKHWAALVGAAIELFVGLVILLVAFFVPPQAWWVPAVIGGGISLHASWRLLDRHMDRFVITNMRVFRVHGILSQRIATMPLSRILDISVHKPIIGRVFGYGHFVFESAAQEQGLREIRYVGDPDQRGLTIQRVIQQSGLRGRIPQQPMDASEPPPWGPRPGPVPMGPAPLGPAPTPAAGSPFPASAGPLPPAPAAPDPASPAWTGTVDHAVREDERRDEERRRQATQPIQPVDPDRTSTAPIDLPR